jgi:hypothetical protein
MSLDYGAWCAQLTEAAVEGFFFSREAASQLVDRNGPNKRQSWLNYYEEGFGPEAALEEDLDIEVRS